MCCIQTLVQENSMQEFPKYIAKQEKDKKNLGFIFPFEDNKQKKPWMTRNIIRVPKTLSGSQNESLTISLN